MASAAFLGFNPAAQAMGSNTTATMATGDSGGDSGSRSSTQSAAIAANDFLTLLVAEMKNQDPTANRDPNEYVNQLVQVNSLQQLISINEVLTNTLGTPSPSSSSTAKTEAAQTSGARATVRAVPPGSAASVTTEASKSPLTRSTTGNLGVPATNPSALGIAHAFGKG